MIESRNQKVTDNNIDKGNIFPLVDFWITVNDFGNSKSSTKYRHI